MSGQRIIFTHITSGQSPKLATWREHRARVLGTTRGHTHPAESGPVVVWHLTSSNNRELARGADTFENFGAAVASAELAMASATLENIVLVSDQMRGQYGWYLSVKGRPLAICARWYNTVRERKSALELATVGLVSATVASGARQLEDSGHER